jgi:putative transposase
MKENTIQNGYEYLKIIFFTKYNRYFLVDEISKKARQLVTDILLDLNCRIYKISVKPNYVFLIIGKPVNLDTSELMRQVKGKTSHQLRKEFPVLVEQCRKALWAVRYRVLD